MRTPNRSMCNRLGVLFFFPLLFIVLYYRSSAINRCTANLLMPRNTCFYNGGRYETLGFAGFAIILRCGAERMI